MILPAAKRGILLLFLIFSFSFYPVLAVRYILLFITYFRSHVYYVPCTALIPKTRVLTLIYALFVFIFDVGGIVRSGFPKRLDIKLLF